MRSILSILLILINLSASAQYDPAAIWTDFATQKQRDGLKRMLYNRTIGNTFSQPLDSNTEYQYQSAFWAIAQFMVYNDSVKTGFQNVLNAYNNKLVFETRRSFLEAIYTVHPMYFLGEMKRIANLEKHPKLFAMIQLWLLKAEPTKVGTITNNIYAFSINNPHNTIIGALLEYVLRSNVSKPSLVELFDYQATHGQKIIYSFQHANRDVPGFAVIQFTDGHFARDGNGKLIMIPQLARSGSNLPFFLTNGNTPQGIYSITGIGISNNNFIGPSPNIQLMLPNEYYWRAFYHEPLDTTDAWVAYKSLLPSTWESYKPMEEAYLAGKLGRTEIIAHGTTIDPVYFTGKMYYPVSPTLGCLCTKEIWDPATGKLKESDQLKLVNGFLQTPGSKGYFMVIEYLPDNVEETINQYEKNKRRP